jgi:peptide/nickel transport system permease protein
MRKAFRNRNFIVGFVLVLFLLCMTLLSVVWTPQDPLETGTAFLMPSAEHWAGTDRLGRDVFSRCMAAGQAAFLIGLCTVSAATVIGVVLGLLAGYYQGFLGSLIMRCTDAFKSIPSLLMAMIIAAILGRNHFSTILAITLILIPQFVRMTRASVLQVREQEYIQWTKLIGLSSRRILFLHILPNVRSTIIVTASLAFSEAVLTEAALSFLGLGVQPPAPSWGHMLSEGLRSIRTAPWNVLLPGLMITFLVLGFNLLGDGLSAALNARSAEEDC